MLRCIGPQQALSPRPSLCLLLSGGALTLPVFPQSLLGPARGSLASLLAPPPQSSHPEWAQLLLSLPQGQMQLVLPEALQGTPGLTPMVRSLCLHLTERS